MKRVHEVEGIGCSIFGEEEDYIDFDDEDKGRKSVAISDLFKAANAETLHRSTACGFEGLSPKEEVTKKYSREYIMREYMQQEVRHYRSQQGRDYPRAYRIKIRIELEELPTDQSDEFWKRRQQ